MLISLNDLLYLRHGKAQKTQVLHCLCAQGVKSNLTKSFPIKLMQPDLARTQPGQTSSAGPQNSAGTSLDLTPSGIFIYLFVPLFIYFDSAPSPLNPRDSCKLPH